MPAPWPRRRRTRYTAQDVASRRQAAVATAATPPEVTWGALSGGSVAHAFSSGPGWMRSVCRRERWTVAWGEPPESAEPCPDCSLLVDGAPGEIIEAYGS